MSTFNSDRPEPAATPTARIAACPHCGASTRLDASNRFRPFCSERCKLIDLGDWLSGRNAIPVATPPDGIEEPSGE